MADTITKYMREGEVLFVGKSLCPDKAANLFLDDIPINKYCQKANEVRLLTANSAAKFQTGVGVVNTTSNAYARVISTSNNIVYLDQNYITLKVGPNGPGSLSSTDFKVDDVVYQSIYIPKGYTGADEIVPATYPTYSSWLNTYGVWIIKNYAGSYSYRYWSWGYHTRTVNYNYDAGIIGTVERTYSAIFPVLSGGATYQYAIAADDVGSLYIDGSLIATVTDNFTTTPSYTNISLTAGVHTIKWVGTNAGAVSTTNPGSIGVHIKTSTGTTIFSSRNPPNVTGYDESVTFQGRVKYFDSGTKTLALLPERGLLNLTANVEPSIIKKVGATSNCNVNSIVTGNQFPIGSTLRETTNTSNSGTVISYSHYSGTFTQANSANAIYTQANLSSSIAGNTITFTSGSLEASNGVYRLITDVSNNLITLNSAVNGITSNTRYSIGDHIVDDFGTVCGIFNISETADVNFKAGERLFTITDTDTSSNNAYTMRASHAYKATSEGTPQTPVSESGATSPVVRQTKVRTLKGFDPMAQTFFVPGANTINSGEIQTSYGIYVSSVDLFFAEKPSISAGDEQLPVTIRIVSVQNDLPSSNVIAESVVECRNINISTVPDMANTSTATKFTFPNPVYLETNATYAITITSDSPYYNIFVAELGGGILGTSPARRVSSQPYVGNFFKAQNASNWTPILNTDLMFRMNRCSFVTNSQGTVVLKAKNTTTNVAIDTVLLHTHERNQKPTSTKYKLKANNVLGQDTGYQYIDVDTEYSFGSDLVTSTKSSNRRRVLVAGDSSSMNVGIELTTSDESVSPVVSKERFTAIALENIINDASLSNSNITITSGGRHASNANIVVSISSPDDPAGTQAYAYATLIGSVANTDLVFSNYGQHSNAANITISFSAPTAPNGTYANAYVSSIYANGNVMAANVIVDCAGSGYVNTVPTITFAEPGTSVNAVAVIRSNVGGIFLTSGGGGSGYYTSPTITITEASMTANATAVVNGETGASGGNCKTRYITKRVDLAPGFDAGDLRIFLDCIRPRGTNINVYYKVKADSDTDPFDSKKWQLMNKVNDLFSIDQEQQIELEFRPNLLKNVLSYTENGVVYPLGGKFKSYAIKIVMTAADTTVVPIVTNFSAIATPEG